MVGNDIVDISLAQQQTNWRRPRYLDKIFTSREQALINHSESPDLMVWRLWSMKEAVYKLYTQIYPSRFYNPKAFECSLNNGGTVKYGAFQCYVQTEITSEYIISEARIGQDRMCSKVIQLSETAHETQSRILRNELLLLASKELQCDKKQLKFVKQTFGIPTIEYKTNAFNVSVSHHGRYGTVAFAH